MGHGGARWAEGQRAGGVVPCPARSQIEGATEGLGLYVRREGAVAESADLHVAHHGLVRAVAHRKLALPPAAAAAAAAVHFLALVEA